jgi:hypothetical protein
MNSIFAKFNLGILAFAILFLAACSGQQESQTETAAEETTEEVQSSSIQTREVTGVVDGYLKLKDALVASNAEEARQIAISMVDIADADDMPQVIQAVTEISNTTDLEAQREHFELLSTSLYEQIQNGVDPDQTLYKQYCPMAFNDKGAYWLSAQEEIRNPYFGDRMLKCGAVQETLAAN